MNDASMKDYYAALAEEEAINAALVAYHEAGHAVLCLAAGVLPDEATMVGYRPGEGASVSANSVEGDPAKTFMYGVAICMAGMAAERLYAEQEGLYGLFVDLDKVIRSGGKSDRRRAVRLVEDCTGAAPRRETEKILAGFEAAAGKDLKERWATVEAIAAALLKEYRLDRARLAEIIEASTAP